MSDRPVNGKGWFLSPEEAAAAGRFQGCADEYYATARRFGSAGGPDTILLSDSGKERAYDIAAVYRFRLNIGHIHALETIAGAGDTGVSIKTMERTFYMAARQLDFHIDKGAQQQSLAASLRGDHAEYVRIQDRNQLLYVDSSTGDTIYRITSLGNDLIRAAASVSESMLQARTEFLAESVTADEPEHMEVSAP